MAKKIVRGITDVKTINNQDFDTNNVNDLLSDGQYNYIHRKKGKSEEYHNLTDNIKTISSDNTELLSVTNYNKTTNTATLHPKHDAQKEQVLESTRNTITIHHGENGTAEKTTVDTNPQKVLEHENLQTTYGISKSTAGNNTTLGLEYTKVNEGFDLNTLVNGNIRGYNSTNAPTSNTWYFVSTCNIEGHTAIQIATGIDPQNTTYVRLKSYNNWGEWREQVGDKSVIDELLSQKQNTLISDSEYITLEHQTGNATSHIKTAALKEELTNLHQTKQDTLVAGTGITIQGHTISATGATLTVQDFASGDYNANKYVFQSGDVQSGYDVLTTFVFNCFNSAETVLTGELKEELEEFTPQTLSISSGALSIKRDGADIKLINSAPSENVIQHATFTFHDYILPGGGGGGDFPPAS